MGITGGSNGRGKRGGRRQRRRAASANASPAASATQRRRSPRKTTTTTTSPAPSKNKSMRFTIPSDFSAQHDVQEQILSEAARKGFQGDDMFAIKISLEEALINAIKHGNKLDPAKRVRIEASITPKQAEIIVEDEGPGFDRTCVPDPTLEENLQKCSGRGILLMEAYMNKVEWSNSGRRVRMIKKNEK